MAKARLTKIGLRNFKSFGPEYQEIDVAPLTVVVGRNSSGKSTLIQALLLLKQTLEQPRGGQLHLEGYVDALSLNELTHGWPEGTVSAGPEITLEWESVVEVRDKKFELEPDWTRVELAQESGVSWIESARDEVLLRTRMEVEYAEWGGTLVSRLELSSWQVLDGDGERYVPNPSVRIAWDWGVDDWIGGEWLDESVGSRWAQLRFDRFLPYLKLPRNASRSDQAIVQGFRLLYEQPLDDLKALLLDLRYLGSSRIIPPSVYRPSSAPPDDVGVSGEYAAQLLHARRSEKIHYLPLFELPVDGAVELPDTMVSATLVDAVNTIFRALSVNARFELQEIKDVGFRLLFGKASLQHVGRGIGYLLPVVVAGLVADPLKGQETADPMSLDEYLEQCDSSTLIALEEPESHTHPKVQTLLAHLMVSLARASRQVIVETHSDHLVRRLRGLIAHAAPGSETEQWLRDNVNIISVEQDDQGVSRVKQSRLTPQGAIAEHWPAEFMDEAPDEERSIYYAALDKREEEPYAAGTEFIDGDEKDEGE